MTGRACFPALLLVLCVSLAAQGPPLTMSGRIVSATTGRPIPGARARLVMNGSDVGVQDPTDADGRFRFTNLGHARYRLEANAPGYQLQIFGEEPVIGGTLIAVQPGHPIQTIEIRLHRGSTIAGVVIDDLREPVVAGSVRAYARRWANGEIRLVSVKETQTDDRGQYRLTGLDPGQYLMGGVDRTAVTFAPAAAAPSGAALFTVGADEEKTGANIQMRTPKSGTIEGLVNGPGAVGSRRIELTPDPNPVSLPPSIARLEPGGRFVFGDVPAGRYLVIARPTTTLGEPQSWGLEAVVVAGDATTRATITLREGTRISGHLEPTRAVGLGLSPVGRDRPEASPSAVRISGDGSFVFSSVPPGRYQWMTPPSRAGNDRLLLSVFINGSDVTDFPLVVDAKTVLENVRVVLNATPGQITGTVTDAASAPLARGCVVVVASDPRYWTTISRRVRVTRADTAGFFEVSPLPPGRYRVSHVASLAPGQLWDTAFLKSLSGAQEIALTEGQTATVQLRLK